MSKRTKVISFIAIVLAIIIIFGVGIGIKKGWFAGLADVISGTPTYNVKIKVNVKKMINPNGDFSEGNLQAMSGVEVIGDTENMSSTSLNCIKIFNPAFTGPEAASAIGGAQKGITGGGGYSLLNLQNVTGGKTIRLRVQRFDSYGRLNSCAFSLSPADTLFADPVLGPQVFKRDVGAQGGGTTIDWGEITFIYSGPEGGTEPPPVADKGAIDGYVYGKNPAGGDNIPVAGVKVSAGGQKTNTDADGHYLIGNLDRNTHYTVRFTAPTCNSQTIGYQDPPGSDVLVAVDSSPTKPSRVTPDPTVLEIGTSAQAYSVFGTVKDEITGNAISKAKVTLKAGDTTISPSPVETNTDGFYMICPISAGTYVGDYTVSATADGYVNGDPVTISGLQTAKNYRQDLTLRAAPAVTGYFNITGVVYNGCSSSPVLPPVVSVKLLNLDDSIVILQSGQQAVTTTAQQGDYQFNGIPITENPAQFKLFVARMGQDKTKLVYIPDVNDGQTFTVNTSLMSQSDLGSITGRVIEKNTQAPINVRAGETLRVIIKNPLDNSTQEILVQSDGTFNATNIDKKHLNTPVKLKAVYTRTEDGQPKEYISYAHIQSGLGDFVSLGCIVTGIKIEIDVSGQPPAANEKRVIVQDKSNNSINGALVTLAEWDSVNGEWIDRDTKKTNTYVNPDGSRAEGVAIFNHNYTFFRYTASREDYGSDVRECKPGEDCQTVIMHLKKGEDPVNPTSTDVEYIFQLLEGPKTTNEDQIKFAKAVAEAFGMQYFDNFFENTPFAQQNVLGFIKKPIASFARGKWQILPGGQWQTWEEFETWAKANAGVSKIEWDTAFVPGATAKKPIIKDICNYTVRVTFKDAASRNQFATKLFNQLQIRIVVQGDDKDKITYDPANVDSRMYSTDDTDSNRIFITPLVFRFNIDAGYIKDIKFSEQAERSGGDTGSDNTNANVAADILKGVKRIGGAIIEGMKKSVIKKNDGTNVQGQQEDTASLRPGEILIGEYKFDENGAIFEPNLGVGTYRWVVTSFSKYRRDSRANNSFTVKSNTESMMINTPFCYADDGIYELNDQGLNYKYFGNLGSGYSRLPQAANLAKIMINKTQVNNILYIGDSNTSLNTSSGYFDGSITFCQTTGVQSQDKVVSGKNIIVTDKLLADINDTGAASQKNQILATKLTELSGYPLYNGLASTQKTSWSRIARAVDTTGNPSQIYRLFIEESQIKDYINTNDVATRPEALYSLAMAAYKNRGAIIKQRIEQMGANSAEQNVAKAIVRHALETAGANGTTDNNLYQPQGRQLSQTIYPVAQIKSGNWLKNKYSNLSASQKISITYTQLISAIRGNKAADAVRAAITSFNNWVDSLRGITNTGTVEGRVLRNGQSVKDVVVTIGNKVAVTNSNGDFKITRVPMGSQVVDAKDRKTSAALPLKNPEMRVNVIKNQTITTTIRLNQQ